MKRKEFIKTCGLGCLGLASSGLLFSSCTSTKYVSGAINEAFVQIPISSFQEVKRNGIKTLDYVVVENNALQYPICVYRKSESEYKALLMKCTHQGTELQVFGDRLQCPAHGSEFSNSGAVQNGPADTSLRSFPVIIDKENLKIDLA